MMDKHTIDTKTWLDERYSRDKDGCYFAHQPIYGLETTHSEPNAIVAMARTYHLLKIFEGFKFDSFLDVGGGEGYLASLVHDLYGIETHSCDISAEACFRAREIFDIQGVATDALKLPFLDRSFDLVVCSEVIEHLTQPLLAISELLRIARKYVIITTAEFCPLGELERSLSMQLRDTSQPHAEQNWFTERDFRILFDNNVFICSQMDNLGGRITQFFADRSLTRVQVEKALEFLTESNRLDVNHDGVIVIVPLDEGAKTYNINAKNDLDQSRKQDILDRLLVTQSEMAIPVTETASLDQLLIPKLRCLACERTLSLVNDQLVCDKCDHIYQVRNGVPLMFLEKEDIPQKTVSDADIVFHFANSDINKEHNVAYLVEKLHGPRPSFSSLKCAVAHQLLRILWLLRRPEPIGRKINRIFRRLTNKPPVDYDAITAYLGLD